MKSIVYILAAIFSLSLSMNTSFAGELSNIYLGAGVGGAKADLDFAGADEINDSDTSFKIFGGADIFPNFAIEGGYIYLGEASAHWPLFDETDTWEGSSLFLTGVGKFNVTDRLHIRGKAGVAIWYVDIAVTATVLGTVITGSGDSRGIAPMFGLGAGFKVNEQLSIIGEWERYQNVGDGTDVTIAGVGSVQIDGVDVDNLGVALIYHF